MSNEGKGHTLMKIVGEGPAAGQPAEGGIRRPVRGHRSGESRLGRGRRGLYAHAQGGAGGAQGQSEGPCRSKSSQNSTHT